MHSVCGARGGSSAPGSENNKKIVLLALFCSYPIRRIRIGPNQRGPDGKAGISHRHLSITTKRTPPC